MNEQTSNKVLTIKELPLSGVVSLAGLGVVGAGVGAGNEKE